MTLPARRVVATGGLCTVINSISNIKTTLVLFKVVVVVGIGVGAGSSVGGVLKNIYEVYICTRILFLWIFFFISGRNRFVLLLVLLFLVFL